MSLVTVVCLLGVQVIVPPDKRDAAAPDADLLVLDLGVHLLTVTVPVAVPAKPLHVMLEAAEAGAGTPRHGDRRRNG